MEGRLEKYPSCPLHLCSVVSPGKNTGIGCHFLLQGIYPNQGSNLSLLSLIAGGFFTTEPSGKPSLPLADWEYMSVTYVPRGCVPLCETVPVTLPTLMLLKVPNVRPYRNILYEKLMVSNFFVSLWKRR